MLLAGALLAGCGEGTCGSGPGVDGGMASAERWVRVLSVPAMVGEGTIEVPLQVVAVDQAHDEGPPRTERVGVHASFMASIEEGLAHHDDVFLALASTGLERELVSYVVVRGSDGSHRLEGICQGESFLRARLGDGYDAAIDAVIGQRHPARILRALGATPG